MEERAARLASRRSASVDGLVIIEGLGLLIFGAIVVIGGGARLRGRRSRFDRIGGALGNLPNVDGLPNSITGARTEVPPRPDERSGK